MIKTLYALIFIITLNGCTQTIEQQPHDLNIPDNWRELSQTDPIKIASEWWRSFNSHELNQLMIKALENNNELQTGIYKIEQAKAKLKISDAKLMPEINANAATSNTRTNPVDSSSYSSNSIRTGIAISYEVDLFGANKAASVIAQKDLQKSEYDLEALKLIIMGDVADNYFSLIALNERLNIAENNLRNANQLLNIVKSRNLHGLVSNIEVAQQKANIEQQKASIASIKEQITNTENSLSVLLGTNPQAIKPNIKSLAELKLPVISPEIPSRILEQRPDIRIAEANLYIANANIAIARAALFPSFSLTSGWNISASGINNPTSTALSLASSLALPIFNGWRLEARVEQATAREKEMLENYRYAILNALRETDNAITAVKTAKQKETYMLNAFQQQRQAYDLSFKKYQAGAIDYQTLLNAENAKKSAEGSYIQEKLKRFSNTVTLFKALGGGWN